MFLIFLSICRFGGFSLSFFFFESMQVLCTLGINMLIFFEYMQVLCAAGGQNHAFFASHAGLERYKSQNLQRVCHFEVNKAQIKTESGFDFLTILSC